jgi:hypothetical protein
VQIAAKKGGRQTILEHIGSARSDGELAALVQVARSKLEEGRGKLDLGLDLPAEAGVVRRWSPRSGSAG